MEVYCGWPVLYCPGTAEVGAENWFEGYPALDVTITSLNTLMQYANKECEHTVFHFSLLVQSIKLHPSHGEGMK